MYAIKIKKEDFKSKKKVEFATSMRNGRIVQKEDLYSDTSGRVINTTAIQRSIARGKEIKKAKKIPGDVISNKKTAHDTENS